MRFVVVGGGATGVEYAGELLDFLGDVLRKQYPQLRPFVHVVLVHGGGELLPQFDEPLRVKALATLQASGVQVRLHTRVESVDSPARLTVRTADAVETIACGLIVWAAGTGPTPLTETLIDRLNDCGVVETAGDGSALEETAGAPSEAARGRIAVDPWLRVVGAPAGTLLALGDAALCLGPDRAPLPQTAQVAAQQGAFVARLLNRGYDLSGGDALDQGYDLEGCSDYGPPVSAEAAGGDLAALVRLRGATEARRFEFLNLGLLAYLGGGEALSQVQVGEQRLLSEAGSTGFLLWRSVYVVKQVSTRTRFLVLFDWLKSRLFGRDVTRW